MRSSQWCVTSDEEKEFGIKVVIQIVFVLQDLRNHGQSFHAQEHNYSVMAEDVIKFLQQLKLDKAVLIGHSMYVISYYYVHVSDSSLYTQYLQNQQ